MNLRNLWQLSVAVWAFQVPGHIGEREYTRLTLDSNSSVKAQVPLGGHIYTCFNMNLTVQNQTFLAQVDTGSTDTALPRTGLAGYSGTPSLSLPIPTGGQQLYAQYGDTSYWYGYLVRIRVSATSKPNVTAPNAPIIMITSQSTSPVFVSGSISQGLMGLAFKPLTNTVSNPYSVMDAWFEAGVIPRNQVSFHGCPSRKRNESWIDFGNETPVTKCGNKNATLYMPTVSHVNIEILQIRVGGTSIPFPNEFQVSLNFTKTYSVLDSCTSLILLPTAIHDVFKASVINSNAFSSRVKNYALFEDWVGGLYSLGLVPADVNFSKLPTLTFTLSTGRNDGNAISLTLGPRQYLEIDIMGYCIQY